MGDKGPSPLVGQVSQSNKLQFKMYLQKCTLSQNDGVVQNIKDWIFQEWNMTFLQNKKILKFCLRDCIFRSSNFLVEVTSELRVLQMAYTAWRFASWFMISWRLLFGWTQI